MKFYKEDWTEKDLDKVEKAIKDHFAGKVLTNHRGELEYFPTDFESIDMILGLPYTSTSMCPMIALDCNVHVFHKYHTDCYYDFVAMDKNKNVVFVITDEKENKKIIYPEKES